MSSDQRPRATFTIWIAETGHELGLLTAAQHAFLHQHLELEGPDDHDYHITPVTVRYLTAEGADRALLALLGRALERVPGQQEVTIEFRQVTRKKPRPRGPFR